MIAADTSSWIAFFEGASGPDVELLDQALRDKQLFMVPAVLAELLSDPELPAGAQAALTEIPMIEVLQGYWERAGRLRAEVLCRRRRARLGDALIAQSCVDHDVSLITRDRDFRAFAEAAGLRILATA